MSEPHFGLLPASDIAERGVICSLLLAPRSVGAICGEQGVKPEHFHSPAFGGIYRLISELLADGKPVDVVTLTQALYDRGTLEQVGGAANISELFTFLPGASNVRQYLDLLHEKHILRRIIAVCDEFSSRSYEEQDNVEGILGELSDAVAAAVGSGIRKDAPTFKQALLDKLERMQNDEPDGDIIETGIEKLDINSPLRLGDMPLIAGERKAGKSILSLTIAANLIQGGRAVLYFSLEDRTPKVIDRIFAGTARIPTVKHHVKHMNEHEMMRTTATITKLCEQRLQIRDDVFDLAQIVAVSRQQQMKWPDLSVVVVDYAQLVRGVCGKNDNREREIASISRTLRLMAMQMNVAVILLSQLNEDGKSRESRTLEQDATAMWMVTKPAEDSDDINTLRYIGIPWQRNGESGIKFPVSFHGHLARMENCTNHSNK